MSVVRASTPLRSYSVVRDLSPIRTFRTIRSVTPFTYPITGVSLLTTPNRYLHSYTSKIDTSPIRSVYSAYTLPSTFRREYDRIASKTRPNPYRSYTDSFLNSEYARVSKSKKKKFLCVNVQCCSMPQSGQKVGGFQSNDIITLLFNRDSMTKPEIFVMQPTIWCTKFINAFHALTALNHLSIHQSMSADFFSLRKDYLKTISILFRYERRYGPDSFASSLSGPLKSTTYNGLHSYNPHAYIGMYGYPRYATRYY